MRRFTERLHRTLLEAFDINSLSQVLRHRLGERLDVIAPTQNDFDTVVFRLILWADQHGRLVELTKAAAADRPHRNDLINLADEVTGEPLDTTLSGGAITDRAFINLTAFARGYERLLRVMPESDQRTVLLEELVTKIRAIPLVELGLPARFHLSDSAGERLAAIVSLRQQPDTQYLWWLAERLGVEYAFAGYHAAVALAEAARMLPLETLDRVADAVEVAYGWVADVPGRSGRRDMLLEAKSVLARRH